MAACLSSCELLQPDEDTIFSIIDLTLDFISVISLAVILVVSTFFIELDESEHEITLTPLGVS